MWCWSNNRFWNTRLEFKPEWYTSISSINFLENFLLPNRKSFVTRGHMTSPIEGTFFEGGRDRTLGRRLYYEFFGCSFANPFKSYSFVAFTCVCFNYKYSTWLCFLNILKYSELFKPCLQEILYKESKEMWIFFIP